MSHLRDERGLTEHDLRGIFRSYGLPDYVINKLIDVWKRVVVIKRQHGGIDKYGKPYIVGFEEACAIYYALQKIPLAVMARSLGVGEDALRKLRTTFQSGGKLIVLSPGFITTITVDADANVCLETVEKTVKKPLELYLRDITETNAWKTYVSPRRGKPRRESEIEETLARMSLLVNMIALQNLFDPNNAIPTNIDAWVDQNLPPEERQRIKQVVGNTITTICRMFYKNKDALTKFGSYEGIANYVASILQLPHNEAVAVGDAFIKEYASRSMSDFEINECVIRHKQIVHRLLPKFFAGEIGALARRFRERVTRELAKPKPTIFYGGYLKMRRMYEEGVINEAEFLIPAIHLACGCREGYSGSVVILKPGAKPGEVREMKVAIQGDWDLDNELVRSSLIGVKWRDVDVVDNNVLIRITEGKTGVTWRCDPSWLDPLIPSLIAKYASKASDRNRSVIKTIILLNRGEGWYFAPPITADGKVTVASFRRWYTMWIPRLGELLNLTGRLTPHGLRRSHLAILAELGVKFEHACSDLYDLGVGWDDFNTARIFYLAVSPLTKLAVWESVRSGRASVEQFIQRYGEEYYIKSRIQRLVEASEIVAKDVERLKAMKETRLSTGEEE